MAIVAFESYDKPWYLGVLINLVVIQSFLTSAPIYGFSSILVVFKKMQFYRQLCPSNFTSMNQKQDRHAINLITCTDQDNALNFVFVIGVVFNFGVKFFAGCIVDKIGAKICQYIGCVFIIISTSCLAFSSQGREYLVIIAFIVLSFGSSFLMLTCYQIVNVMFKKNKSFFLCILSGSVDSSTAVFIIFLELFDNGFSLKTISFAFGSITVVFVILTTAFLYPSLEETNKIIDDDVKILLKEDETTEGKDFTRFCNESTEMFTQENSSLTNKSNDLFNSVTDDSLTQHLFSKLNFLMVFCFSLTQIRSLYFIGNLDKYFDNITDKETGTKYIKYFGLIQFLGILVGPIAGLLFIRKPNDNVKTKEDLKIERMKSLILPGLVFIANIMLLTALQLCEQIFLSIPMFLLYMSSNGLMWCYSTTLYGLLFPPQYFCSMYGFLMGFMGAASFLQSPLLYLEQRVFHGNQLWTNVMFMGLLSLTLTLPGYLWYVAKHLEKKEKKKKFIQNTH